MNILADKISRVTGETIIMIKILISIGSRINLPDTIADGANP
jgi:hypothetical protein